MRQSLLGLARCQSRTTLQAVCDSKNIDSAKSASRLYSPLNSLTLLSVPPLLRLRAAGIGFARVFVSSRLTLTEEVSG